MLSTGTLTDTTTLSRLTDTLRRTMVIDADWNILDFARRMRDLAAGDVEFVTAPARVAPDGTTTADPVGLRAFVSGLAGGAPTTSATAAEDDLEGELPPPEAVERYRRLFPATPARGAAPPAEDGTGSFVRSLLGVGDHAGGDAVGLMSGRFVVYRHLADRRFGGLPTGAGQDAPTLPLPPVAEGVREGRAHLVAELVFRYDLPGHGDLVWLALVEPETGSVLYLECQTCAVGGLVFRQDPNVATGDLAITSAAPDAVLADHDSFQPLEALDAPVGDTQHLSGAYVAIQNVKNPGIVPPTRPAGQDFDAFAPRTDDFAAVNAYYHLTELFRYVEDLGFPVSSYFDGTDFPVPVDHRGLGDADAQNINAHWSPNGTGGTGHMCYGLCDVENLAQPLGRAVDPWVHWHEMGGHGTLGDHVGTGLLGFAHSTGDGLAAIRQDPESGLRGLPERFRYAPFRPFQTERRFDRAVPEWAWGGPKDPANVSYLGDYRTEQILATCHFRLYRALGGDHADLARRTFAARATTYLVLRATGNLTAATNPGNVDPVTTAHVPGRGAQLWCEELQDADLQNWTSEGLFGGAYNKVARWAFEKQGGYGGAAPEVDVHIDDGRAGEYQFQAVHWHNQSVWNRTSPDGLPGHQNALPGVPNFAYAKVKNRGTAASGEVVVKGFHCLPGAGLTWPVDFTPMGPAAGLVIDGIAPDNGEEVVVGPFEWVPNENVHGHDCALLIASTEGDSSNVDHFTGDETVEEWRLVPHDNNVGQRNIVIAPGGGGGEALVAALDGAVFVAGNSRPETAALHVRVRLPALLARKGWRLDLPDAADLRLRPGEKRTLRLRLAAGDDFTAEEVDDDRDRDIQVVLDADGLVLGGMTYRLDPRLTKPSPA
ncbi:hypothetical protein ACQPYE_25140 [Actinosynnema sp. CA-299493]